MALSPFSSPSYAQNKLFVAGKDATPAAKKAVGVVVCQEDQIYGEHLFMVYGGTGIYTVAGSAENRVLLVELGKRQIKRNPQYIAGNCLAQCNRAGL